MIVGSGKFRYRVNADWAKLPEGSSFKEVGGGGVDSNPSPDPNSLLAAEITGIFGPPCTLLAFVDDATSRFQVGLRDRRVGDLVYGT